MNDEVATGRSTYGEVPFRWSEQMGDADAIDLDATAIVRVLNQRGVAYVVIGAFAALAQQARIGPTRDIDITPDRTRENCGRLSDEITTLGARVRTQSVPHGLAFNHDGASLLSVDVWNLVCSHGEFDVSFHPAAFSAGFSDLAQRARRVRVGDVEVLVADLDDVIRSKEAVGRPKDVAALPALYRRQAELRRPT